MAKTLADDVPKTDELRRIADTELAGPSAALVRLAADLIDELYRLTIDLTIDLTKEL